MSDSEGRPLHAGSFALHQGPPEALFTTEEFVRKLAFHRRGDPPVSGSRVDSFREKPVAIQVPTSTQLPRSFHMQCEVVPSGSTTMAVGERHQRAELIVLTESPGRIEPDLQV